MSQTAERYDDINTSSVAVVGFISAIAIFAIIVAVALEALPLVCLLAALPSFLLVQPLRWAFGDPREPVPVPALGANVTWNLGTNLALAATLAAAAL